MFGVKSTYLGSLRVIRRGLPVGRGQTRRVSLRLAGTGVTPPLSERGLRRSGVELTDFPIGLICFRLFESAPKTESLRNERQIFGRSLTRNVSLTQLKV